jgi:transcription elongation GreA/GreB family factor
VGAGTELTGPHGDGFVSVITPTSPVGKALMGLRVGETFDVTIKGDTYEWRVVDLT